VNKFVNISKKVIDSKAPAGNVTTHESTIVLTDLKFIELAPSTRPIPMTAPTKVCVVDTGISS
jgi:hypothetical protein